MTDKIKCPDCGSFNMGCNILENIQHCHQCKSYWKQRWNYNDKGYKIGTPKLEKDSGIFY